VTTKGPEASADPLTDLSDRLHKTANSLRQRAVGWLAAASACMGGAFYLAVEHQDYGNSAGFGAAGLLAGGVAVMSALWAHTAESGAIQADVTQATNAATANRQA
jgi:hypothetical protein